MIKLLRYTEYLYLFVALGSIYKIIEQWNVDQSRVYLYAFFAIVSVGMFLFRRKYRKKFEQRQQDNKQ